jgi:FixJ family two-component response regulator
MNKHNENQPVVAIIDDDRLVREGVADLLNSIGLRTKQFTSVSEFLESKSLDRVFCLVLDVRLPGLSGLDFQSELNKLNIQIPIVFMTGHADTPMTVRAMKAGAVDFLSKPFRDQDMLDAVQAAVEHDRKRRQSVTSISKLKSAFESLTSREQEIMGLVATGYMNKQIASRIGISEATVKFHRGNLMRKMGARSIAELVRIAEALGNPQTSN